MNKRSKLPPEQVLDITYLLSVHDPHTVHALGQQLEWRLFLLLLDAYCTARQWTIEYDTPPDGSVTIFADAHRCSLPGRDPADGWGQEPLFEMSPDW
jgi:hypothetical protein